LAAQLGRYAVSGIVVAVFSAGFVLLLSGPVGWPIQVAIAVSYPFILALHFSLQRFFVFRSTSGYRLTGRAQVRRYLSVQALQYGCIAGGTELMRTLVGLPDQLAYLAAVYTVTAVSFVLMRLRVFH
jgi:putative flippase GtrA